MNEAEILIKREILTQAEAAHGHISDENLVQFYKERQIDNYNVADMEYEVRGWGNPTNLPGVFSRHYENEFVAFEIAGKWVGWLYWHGGGKHSEAEHIPWMEDAVMLEVVNTETVTKHTWGIINES